MDREKRTMTTRHIDLICQTSPRFQSYGNAMSWHCTAALSGFGDLTAFDLVESGRADDLIEYVEAIDAGIYS